MTHLEWYSALDSYKHAAQFTNTYMLIGIDSIGVSYDLDTLWQLEKQNNETYSYNHSLHHGMVLIDVKFILSKLLSIFHVLSTFTSAEPPLNL